MNTQRSHTSGVNFNEPHGHENFQQQTISQPQNHSNYDNLSEDQLRRLAQMIVDQQQTLTNNSNTRSQDVEYLNRPKMNTGNPRQAFTRVRESYLKRLQKLPIFNGESYEQLRDFLEIAQTLNNSYLNQDEMIEFIETLSLQLRGEARDIVGNLHGSTFDEMKNALLKHFSYLSNREVVTSKLENLHQEPNETLTAFADRARKLLREKNRLYNHLSEDQRLEHNRLARKAFSHGISNPNLKTRLLTRGSSSLEDAIAYVIEAENDLISMIPKNETFCNFCNNTGHRERDCRRKNNNNSGVNQLLTALQNLNSGNRQTNNRYNPGQLGNQNNRPNFQPDNRSNNRNFNNDHDNQYNSNNNQGFRNDQYNRNQANQSNFNNQTSNRNQNQGQNRNQTQTRNQNNWNNNQNRQNSSLNQVYPLHISDENQSEIIRPTFRNAAETINENIEQNNLYLNQSARFIQCIQSPSHFTVNFRTKDNKESILNVLQNMQTPTKNLPNLEYELITSNNTMFISLYTNITKRPIKLVVDTGAVISLIADDIILEETSKMNCILDLCGVTGQDNIIQTKGTVLGYSAINNRLLTTTMHLVDRKYAGPADGYLGFDFLSQYKAVIDIEASKIYFKLNDFIPSIKLSNNDRNAVSKDIENGNENLNENNNFLDTLAHSYDFSNKEEKSKHKSHKKEFAQYYGAINFFTDKINKIENQKVNFVPSINTEHISSNSLTSKHADSTTHNLLEISKQLTFDEFIKTDTLLKQYDFPEDYLKRIVFIIDKLILDHCTIEQKKIIWTIIASFPLQFYVDGDVLSSTDIIKHEIKLLPGSNVVNLRQYRIPHTQKKILEEIVNEHERQGIIEKCQSNYNSPAIVIPKKGDNGEYTDFRLVVDYRKLNEITEVTNFPIPLIDDILDGLNGCSYFTTIDIKGAFHQILMEESSRDYTAFTANNFQYRWLRMPFGLSSAPLTWQRAINTILNQFIGRGVYVYLDDVIIHTKTEETHNEILWKIFELFKTHNLQLKISKCVFFAKQFDYLGHVITKDGIKANPKKLEAIKNFPIPKNVKKIQSFLGLCSYFRRYVRNFAQIAKPLSMLLKNEQPFIWSPLQQKSFDDLKQALIDQVVLSFPDFNQLFYVTTDASDVAIGAMLSQGELPNDRPISFYSKVLNETQKRYSTIEKELLAIVEAIKAFRVYLYGRFFVLITDHRPLCYLFNMKDCGSRLFRQKIELQDYNFKIIYRAGAQNHVADALSRLEPLTIEEILEINKKQENCFALTRAQARKEIDDLTNNVKYAIEEKNDTILTKRNFDLIFHFVPTENDTLKHKLINKFAFTNFPIEWHNFAKFHYVCSISNQFSNRENANVTQKRITEILDICGTENVKNIAINLDYDNLRHYLFFKTMFQEIFLPSNVTTTFFLNKVVNIIEQDDIDLILDMYHKTLLGGHIGADKMLHTISKFYKWDNMAQSIKNYVKKCAICEKTKVTTNTKAPMQISSLGECLFDHTFIDFVGPISPPSIDGHKYIFTAICDLTKYLIAVPTKDCSALTTAECLIEHIFLRYNFPSRLISDNASNFHSQVIKEINQLFKIKKIFTTPYHPQSNIVERSHRTLNAYLRAYTSKNKDIWHELLKYATFAYNNSIHSTTGYTAHELAHGFRILIPNNLNKPKISYNYDNLADITRNNIAKVLELAKEHLMTRKIANKQYYDSNVNDVEIHVNDLVLLKTQTKNNKFQNIYEGPYRVIDISESYAEILKKGKNVKVHKNLLKKALANHNEDNSLKFPTVNLDDNDLNDFL